MASVFSKIIAGEIPCYKVAENDYCIAFLDISPLAKGHLLCVPKQEVDYIFDLDDKTFTELHLFSKKVAKALAKVCPCLRIGTAVIGVDVPHAHIHLIPLNSSDDIDFKKPHLSFPPEEMQQLASAIAAAID